MITLRPARERGHADHDWLDSRHSFPVADDSAVAPVQWGPLRVLNEDRVAPGRGLGEHAHHDMELISYVLEGALAHRDSMGTASTIEPGDVQRMSAGTGVTQSEHNHDRGMRTHLLQIGILPDRTGLAPSYSQKHFTDADKRGRLRLIASPDGADGSVLLHQDARLYAGLFNGAEGMALPLAAGRLGYVQVARGSVLVNGQRLGAGDALLMQDEARVILAEGEGAEVLVFDLPPT